MHGIPSIPIQVSKQYLNILYVLANRCIVLIFKLKLWAQSGCFEYHERCFGLASIKTQQCCFWQWFNNTYTRFSKVIDIRFGACSPWNVFQFYWYNMFHGVKLCLGKILFKEQKYEDQTWYKVHRCTSSATAMPPPPHFPRGRKYAWYTM